MLSLRSYILPLLGAALLAYTASAQTKPTPHKATKATHKPAPRSVPNTTPAARAADPLRGTNDNGAGQSGYAAPGEPITPPDAGGKNTGSYDGKAKPTQSNTTLTTPK